jgi:hypothetical protein
VRRAWIRARVRSGSTDHAVKLVEVACRDLAEARFRFNRRCNVPAIPGSLMPAVVATLEWPERGIRVAEVHHQSGSPVPADAKLAGQRP